MSGQVDTISFKFKRHRPQSLNLSCMSIHKLTSDSSSVDLDRQQHSASDAKTAPASPSAKTGTAGMSLADSNEATAEPTKSSIPSKTSSKRPNIIIDSSNSGTNIKSVKLQYHQDHADVALRLVSPGLPKLSDEMKNTMKLSQQIHIQQKHIIEARKSGNDEEEFLDINRFQVDDTSDNNDSNDNSSNESSKDVGKQDDNTSEKQSSASTMAATTVAAVPVQTSSASVTEDSKLSAASAPTSRGLKRKHVPSPLNIDESVTAPNPAIHSAPLFSRTKFNNPKKFQTTPVSKSFTAYLTPHKSSPYNQGNNKKVRMVSHNHSPFAQATSSTSPYFARSKAFYQQYTPQPSATTRMYPPLYYQPNQPYTAGIVGSAALGAERQPAAKSAPTASSSATPPQVCKAGSNTRLEAQLYTLGIPTESRKVVDVFRNDLIKDAPIQSQPLSSQKEFFDHTPSNIRQLIEEDRSPASEDEIKEMQEKYKKYNELYGVNQPQPAGPYPYPPPMNPHMNAMGVYPPGQIPAQLPRYPMPPNLVAPGRPNEIFGSIQFMNEKFFNFKIFDDESDVSKREKFLKLCEKTWDEFIAKKAKD